MAASRLVVLFRMYFMVVAVVVFSHHHCRLVHGVRLRKPGCIGVGTLRQ
jgi:hypothetical protein